MATARNVFHIYLDRHPDLIEELDKLSAKTRLSKSQLFRMGLFKLIEETKSNPNWFTTIK